LKVLKRRGFRRATNAAKRSRTLQVAEKLIQAEELKGFVTGHDFSRAANGAKSMVGFSPC
jgi:hypothetical protein